MLAVAIRTLRTRWTAIVGAFIAATLGVALVACWGILMESALRAKVPPERLAGAPIVVAGKQTLKAYDNSLLLPERARVDASLVGKIRALPGVTAAIPEVSFPAAVLAGGHSVPGDRPIWGHGWGSAPLTPFHLRAGTLPRGSDDIVVDSALARRGNLHVGSRVQLAATGAFTVTGITSTSLAHEGSVFVSDATATSLAGHPGTVDAIGVFPRDAAPRVEKAVGTADAVLTGTDRGKAEFLDATQGNEDLVAMAGVVGGVGIAVSVFVIAATLSVSVQQRQREIALLRAVAATPRQIRGMIAAEGLVLSLAAALVGVLPGMALARSMSDAFVHKGILSDFFRLHVGWIPFLVAGGVGVLSVQAAAFAAGRRASRVRPTEALQESATEPKLIGAFRLVLGLLALAGGIALLSVSLSLQGESEAGTAIGVVMVLMVAVGFLGPLIARVGGWLVGALIRGLSGSSGFLAATNARARSRRLASAMTPVALTVALEFITVFLQSTIAHAENRQSERRIVADRILRAGGPGLPPSVVDRVKGIPGVATAVGLTQTDVVMGHDVEDYAAQGVLGDDIGRALDLDVHSGSLNRLAPGTIALSADRAGKHRIGDPVSLWLGDGTKVTLRLAATYSRSLGFADALLPGDLTLSHVTVPAASLVLVSYNHGVNADRALRRLSSVYPTITVTNRSSYRAQQAEDEKVNAWINYVVLGVIVAYAAIAMANTMVMTIAERRREFALMRLIGATGRQVLQMVRWEAGMVALIGVVVGTGAGFATLLPFSRGLSSTASPYVPPLDYLVMVLVVAALGFTATLWPARVALRQRPIEAAGIRE